MILSSDFSSVLKKTRDPWPNPVRPCPGYRPVRSVHGLGGFGGLAGPGQNPGKGPVFETETRRTRDPWPRLLYPPGPPARSARPSGPPAYPYPPTLLPVSVYPWPALPMIPYPPAPTPLTLIKSKSNQLIPINLSHWFLSGFALVKIISLRFVHEKIWTVRI